MKIDAGIISSDAREAGISAKNLEDAGYDGAFTYEGPHDPFLPLVGAALSTEKIEQEKLIDAINYLIENQIISISKNQSDTIEIQKIPSWIKIITSWWIDGQIDDKTFVQSLEFLVQKSVITI